MTAVTVRVRHRSQAVAAIVTQLVIRRGGQLDAAAGIHRAAKLIGISRAAAYRFASAGQLPTKRLGHRIYVVTAKLREFIMTEGEAA